MRIDLHIHTSTGSDGALSVEEVFREAQNRKIDLMSITDHDSIAAQEKAVALASEYGISYITGVELNVAFQSSVNDKSVSLDFLGYRYDISNRELQNKLELLREHREGRARQILGKLNFELEKENHPGLTEEDMRRIEEGVDGAIGRPHIARYLVEKGIAGDIQGAFDKYLVRCDVPKYPLSLAEASELVRNAGGILVLAHPDDSHGTSLVSITTALNEQTKIVAEYMLDYIDGIECWHTRHDTKATLHYLEFANKHNLLVTGGTDCHQKPVIMGTLDIPDYVANQFKLKN